MIATTPQTPQEFELYYDLRWRILRMPWDQPKGSEKDELEDVGFHVMVCKNAGERVPLGIGRLHFNTEDKAQIRYMAVEKSHRGNGIGKTILHELERIAAEQCAKQIVLNARENAVAFYEKMGYRVIQSGHTLYGCIKHFKMNKNLSGGRQ